MSKITDAMEAVVRIILREKDYLTELDAAIGDADHGINMARGFEEIPNVLARLEHPEDAREVLQAVGDTLLEYVGGAAGPLYGTGFIHAAKALDEDARLTIPTVEKALGAAIAAIRNRGRSGPGDKTMLDVLMPIHECFTPEQAEGLTLFGCLAEANYAANAGVEYTKTIPARKGRATYIGERSIGHADPGAVSSMLMFRAVYQFLNR